MPVNSLQIKAQFRLLGQLGLESCSLASMSRTSWLVLFSRGKINL